ncbi:MAG: Na+/H+ antiporter NhaC family protein [Oscillospiraceae bacterium]|nr:Na+/H+ antiporter NhaC family protein [Oscillospiraceae bacterium]
MVGTFWAFAPAIIAIVLALVTKQVYVSLFLGIFVGAMMYVGGNPISAMQTLYELMSEKVGANVPIIVFLVVLGILVILMQKSGGAMAYGNWAQRKIKSKSGALAATAGLGCLIFVDDYFNCLTVGSVMSPVTDKFKVSRAKLAYIIDSTAAPVCIIAPISSWAAAVAGELEGDGLIVFIKTIPFNLYALLTVAMVFALCFLKLDFGKMRKNEYIAETTGDLTAGEHDESSAEENSIVPNARGKVRHLVIPVIVLIVCCIAAMLYTGYQAEGVNNFIDAFSKCDAGLSLAIGSTFALVIIAAYYMIAKVVSFKEITGSFTQGFKAMVPAILILTFAWSISGIMGAKGGYLDARAFVQENLAGSGFPEAIMPAIFFLLAGAIAFATGTSWGTFGVLVPIAVTILGGSGTLTIMTVAATLGGAVLGDHISPISDTTILASAGAKCNHVDHVNTQLPYALLIGAVAFVTYLIAGFCASLGSVASCLIMWAVAIALFAGVLVLLKYLDRKKSEKA